MIVDFKCTETEGLWNGVVSRKLPRSIQSVARRKLRNIHPSEILLEEFLKPTTISQNRLARDINVAPRRINEIVHWKRSITVDTDWCFLWALGTSEGFWLGLQNDYDLEEQHKVLDKQLRDIKNLTLAFR